jgi:hypothetical protein
MEKDMRISALVLAAIVAVSLAACSKSSDNSQAGSTATTAAETSAPAGNTTTTAGGMTASTEDKTGLPSYPGATVQAGGSTAGGAMGNASGKVMTTSDSFDKVYKWYQEKMPKGSEKAHMTVAGNEMATFQIGEAGSKNQQVVTITAQNGKTQITLASVSK